MTTKKIGASTIALIVVSVLLIMSLTVTATLAWFMDNDSANSPNILMGERVEVTIDRSDVTGGMDANKDEAEFDVVIFADAVVPGMKVAPNLRVYIADSTTTVVLRTRLSVTVTGGSGITGEQRIQLQEDIIAAIVDELGDDWVYVEIDGTSYDDKAGKGWFYYLGNAASSSYTHVMTRTAEGVGESGGTKLVDGYDAEFIATTNGRAANADASTVAATINSNGTERAIYFFNPANQFFRIPTSLDNNYAGATITLTFEAEVIQDFLLDADEDYTVLPTISDIARILYQGE